MKKNAHTSSMIIILFFLILSNYVFGQRIYIKEVKVSTELTYPLLKTEEKKLKEIIKNVNLKILKDIFGDNIIESEIAIRDRLEQEVVDSKIEPYGYLVSLGYTLLFNTDKIFSFQVRHFRSTKGTDEEEVQYSINTKTGNLVTFDDVFNSNFHKVVDNTIKVEFSKRLKESLLKYKIKNGTDGNILYEDFKIENSYQDFKFSQFGITLIYDNMIFSMGNRDCWPSKEYYFSWKDIKLAIKSTSPIQPEIK